MRPPEVCIKGMNGGANDYNNDEDIATRQWKHYAVEYPVGTVLSVKAINENAPGGGKDADSRFFAIQLEGRLDLYCGWAVAVLSKDSQATGNVQAAVEVKSAEAIAAEEFERLGL